MQAEALRARGLAAHAGSEGHSLLTVVAAARADDDDLTLRATVFRRAIFGGDILQRAAHRLPYLPVVCPADVGAFSETRNGPPDTPTPKYAGLSAYLQLKCLRIRPLKISETTAVGVLLLQAEHDAHIAGVLLDDVPSRSCRCRQPRVRAVRSSAARALITRSAVISGRSARWAAVAQPVELAGGMRVGVDGEDAADSAARPSSRSGGSCRSGRQLISTPAPFSRHAVNTPGRRMRSGRPRPERAARCSAPERPHAGSVLPPACERSSGRPAIRRCECTLATTMSSSASRSSRWSREPSSRMSTSIPVRRQNGASCALSR